MVDVIVIDSDDKELNPNTKVLIYIICPLIFLFGYFTVPQYKDNTIYVLMNGNGSIVDANPSSWSLRWPGPIQEVEIFKERFELTANTIIGNKLPIQVTFNSSFVIVKDSTYIYNTYKSQIKLEKKIKDMILNMFKEEPIEIAKMEENDKLNLTLGINKITNRLAVEQLIAKQTKKVLENSGIRLEGKVEMISINYFKKQ